MNFFSFLLLLLIAAICGSIGQKIAGYSTGGCLVSVVIGFIGAFIGSWIAAKLGLRTIWVVEAGGQAIPILWTILGAALFSLIVGLITKSRKNVPNHPNK